MTKDQLHQKIKSNSEVTEEDFISVYGHCKSRSMGGASVCAADILAKVYNKAVSKSGNVFSFSEIAE